MQYLTPTPRSQAPWNKGKLVGQKPPFKLQEVWSIRTRLQIEQRIRDLALFNLAIDSKLRGCDLVTLTVSDVMHGSPTVSHATVVQHETQHPVRSELTEQTRDSVKAWIDRAGLEGVRNRPNPDTTEAASIRALPTKRRSFSRQIIDE